MTYSTEPFQPSPFELDDALQLELFPDAGADLPPESAGVSRTVARASVSPGWWRLIAPLYDVYQSLVVEACHETDGRLVLRATPDDELTTADFEATLQRICEVAERTCGCCGGSPASAHRQDLRGPTRVVCDACWARLRDGESYVEVSAPISGVYGT